MKRIDRKDRTGPAAQGATERGRVLFYFPDGEPEWEVPTQNARMAEVERFRSELDRMILRKYGLLPPEQLEL